MSDLVDTWSGMFPSMIIDEEDQVDTGALFIEMKATTIDYLGLIFMTGFEYHEPESFVEDNTLSVFWDTFHPWLEVDQCNALVSYALAGKLGAVNNIEILRKLMAT